VEETAASNPDIPDYLGFVPKDPAIAAASVAIHPVVVVTVFHGGNQRVTASGHRGTSSSIVGQKTEVRNLPLAVVPSAQFDHKH